MRCCNPSRVFPINMCGCHSSRNMKSHENTNASWFRRFCCCVTTATSSRSLMCICDQESRSSEPSSAVILHREREQIRFLGSDLHDCSLTSSSSSPQLVYLFVGRASRVIAFNANSVRPSVICIQLLSMNCKSRTVPTLKSCLTYLIC
jgi:hypothetical protein